MAFPAHQHQMKKHKHLLLLLLFAIGLIQLVNICDCQGHHLLSYSECLQLERSGGVDDPFLNRSPSAKVVSVREGQPAYLHCAFPQRQQQRGRDLKVAWTRLSDDALLAVGITTFTQDPRFQPRKDESDWVLILRRSSSNDQGCYLCEVNTEPTSTLVPVYLKVIIGTGGQNGDDEHQVMPSERSSTVEEGANAYKRTTHLHTRIDGNTLLLNCTVEGAGGHWSLGRWPIVVWTKDGRPIDLSDRQRYTTEQQRQMPDGIVYSLRIHGVSPSNGDGGEYACEGDQLIRSSQIVNLVNTNTRSVGWRPDQWCIANIIIQLIIIMFSVF